MAGRRSPREQISDALELDDRPFVGDVPGVQRRIRFDQDNVDLFVRDGAVLDAVRDHNEFAFAHHTFTIAEFHAEGALDDEKKLVFVIVMMPEKFSFELDGFHKAIIDFTYDARQVVLGNEIEFFLQVYRVHGAPIDCEPSELQLPERGESFRVWRFRSKRAKDSRFPKRGPSPIRHRPDKA